MFKLTNLKSPASNSFLSATWIDSIGIIISLKYNVKLNYHFTFKVNKNYGLINLYPQTCPSCCTLFLSLSHIHLDANANFDSRFIADSTKFKSNYPVKADIAIEKQKEIIKNSIFKYLWWHFNQNLLLNCSKFCSTVMLVCMERLHRENAMFTWNVKGVGYVLLKIIIMRNDAKYFKQIYAKKWQIKL